MRQSVDATYDHRETGDRFTVETRLDGKRLSLEPTCDPFVHTTVHVGLRDLLRAVLRRRLSVSVVVSGDSEIVEDVCELNDDYTGRHDSTRRRDWDAQIRGALERL
jgi:hypothetical protein